jgi:hypothetical protein
LVRCCCGCPLGCRRVALTVVSTTRRTPIYATQPGSLPGCSPCSVCHFVVINYAIIIPKFTSLL